MYQPAPAPAPAAAALERHLVQHIEEIRLSRRAQGVCPGHTCRSEGKAPAEQGGRGGGDEEVRVIGFFKGR